MTSSDGPPPHEISPLGQPATGVKHAQPTGNTRTGASESNEQSHDALPVTGLTGPQVEHLVAAERRSRSLDEPLHRDEGDLGSFGDVLADPLAEDAYDDVSRRHEVESLPGLLEDLDERERTIVSCRFGLEGPEQTLREIAEAFGISAERVRQLEQRALDKLREALQP